MNPHCVSHRAAPLLLVLSLCLGGCRKDEPQGPTYSEGEGVLGQWVSSGGYIRTYTLFVPENPSGQPLPLLIVLHGASGTGQGMRSAIGLDALAAREGLVVAYPDGLGSWAVGLGTAADRAGVDDVQFMRTLIRHLTAELPIDRDRVHVAGLSDGGTMSCRLGCAMTAELASITAVASGISIFQQLWGSPSGALSVQIIVGTRDQIFPWQDVAETARLWALLNGCSTTETETLPDDPSDDVIVHRTDYGGCTSGKDVRFFLIEGGGHTWPGSTWDPSVVSFSATDALLEFATGHSRGLASQPPAAR